MDSPVRKASTKRTIKANRLKRFKAIGRSFLMLRILAHEACVGALAAHALGQKFGDDVQSLGRREFIALDRLGGVDRHASVHVRCPCPAKCWATRVMGNPTRRAGGLHHLRERFRSWRAVADRNPSYGYHPGALHAE